MRPWLATALLLSACTGDVGRISISLVTSPNSDPLADAVTARLRLTSPDVSVEEDITSRPVRLSIDIEARDALASLVFEAEDADGNLVASGATPPLPLTAIDFELRVFVAPPWSIVEAPASFETPRGQVGAASLSFGAALVGGLESSGDVSDELLIYNAFQHEFQPGLPLPEGRAGAGAIADARGSLYIVGGRDQNGDDRATTYRFNTGVPPAGSYATLQTSESLARTGARLAGLGDDRFLIAGPAPLGVLDARTGMATPLAGGESLSGPTTSFVVGDDLLPTALIMGLDGAATLRADQLTMLEPPGEALRTGHALILVDQVAVAVGGNDAVDTVLSSALTYDPVAGSFAVLSDFLEVPRTQVGAVSTGRFLVVAGGLEQDGSVSSVVEVFEAADLAPARTLNMVIPRQAPSVIALGNGQVLIAGGLDDTGNPVPTIELLTPGS